MTTAVIRYTAAAATDRGRKRSSNQDAFGYSVEHGVFVVCDGMGGAAGGEIASALAVEELMRQLTSAETPPPTAAATEDAIIAANQTIYDRAQLNERLSGMGTTMVVLEVSDRGVRVLNIGDSRCYCLHNHHLQQITLDHSLVEEEIRSGRMTSIQAQRSPFRNVITRALGTQNQVMPDVYEIASQAGDLFLLCSDGLTRELTDAQIEDHLRSNHPLDKLCDLLIRAANKAGGSDNITCLLIRAE